MLEFLALAEQCAPTVAPQTMAALVHVESSFNPYAIGVVGGRLARQPINSDEAVATAKALEIDGWNFSVGVAQINRYNLPKYELTYEQAFDACANLRAGSKILEDCFVRATPRSASEQAALQAAFSCYYSGNFTRGFRPDKAGEPSYVQKVLAQADVPAKAIPVVPSIKSGQDSATRPKAVKAADSAPSISATTVAIEPADHAPVLLRPSSERDAVRLQRAVPGTNGNEPAQTSETARTGGEARSSVVVF